MIDHLPPSLLDITLLLLTAGYTLHSDQLQFKTCISNLSTHVHSHSFQGAFDFSGFHETRLVNIKFAKHLGQKAPDKEKRRKIAILSNEIE